MVDFFFKIIGLKYDCLLASSTDRMMSNSMESENQSWSITNIKTWPELLQAHKRTSKQPVLTSRWCFHEESTWHSAK